VCPTVILAIDPGETTGLAKAVIDERKLISVAGSEGTLSPVQMFGLLDSISPSYLVAEGFEYRNDSRPGLVLFSRNLLGVCEMWSELRNSCFRTQSAAKGKGFYGNEKLRKLGYYESSSPHARDAVRHLLTFLTFGLGSRLIDEDLMERLRS
jgi:hypothetical protein